MTAIIAGALVMSELKRVQGLNGPAWAWTGVAWLGIAAYAWEAFH